MERFKELVVPTLLFCVLALILVAHTSHQEVQAEMVITPTLIATAWQYLPAVRGEIGGPTATATLPPPTMTASPTLTPSATLGPTSTPEPGRLAAPTLFDILNNDKDGNFKVGWSSVVDAEYYRLEQKRNSRIWETVYEGPEREIALAGLPDGSYCYRVMALNAATDSEWSAKKCTTVSSATSTPTPTTPPGGLTAPILSDIVNPDGDGNYTIQWSSVPGADEYILREGPDESTNDQIIYRGPNISLDRSEMPPGQYCYRVRAIILEGEWGPWSAFKCVTVAGEPELTATPDPLQCTYETVAEIEPGIVGHSMAYLEKLNVVIIAGGIAHELEDPDVPESVTTIPNEAIYLYDVEEQQVYIVGQLSRTGYLPRVTVPLDDNNILITGVQSPNYVEPDVALHIERSTGGFLVSQETSEPLFDDGWVTEMVVIDEHRRLLVHEPSNYVEQNAYVYDTLTDELEFRFYVDTGIWDRVSRMSEGGSRYMGTTGEGVFIGDIRTGATWQFPFPDASESGIEYTSGTIQSMSAVALSETALLLTNGWTDEPDLPRIMSLGEARITDILGNMRKIADTKYDIDSRMIFVLDDGRILLVGGFNWDFGVSTGSEVFDPTTETFEIVEAPSTPHVLGENVKLRDGAFLIAGGIDEAPLVYYREPVYLTGGTLELLTCD